MPPRGSVAHDIVLVGEFSEQTGPVVIDQFVDPAVVSSHDTRAWSEAAHAFMMRAMSGDHTYSSRQAGDSLDKVTFRPCETVMDRVAWRFGRRTEMLVAFVYSLQVSDVLARAYTRTVCFAYLTPDPQKMFIVLPWVAQELAAVARGLFDATRQRHESEVLEAFAAVQHCCTHQARLPLSDRHRLAVKGELEDIRARFVQVTRAVVSPDGVDALIAQQLAARDIVVDDKAAVKILDSLTTQKGSTSLRELRVLCGDYDGLVGELLQRAVFMLSQRSIWLLEGLHGTLQSLPALLSKRFDAIFGGQPTKALRLRIGDFTAVDPIVSRWAVAAAGDGCDDVEDDAITALKEDDLFAKMLFFGEAAVVAVAHHALRGTPVIVCGGDVGLVLDAARFASMFVPALGQSTQQCQVGLLPFDSSDRVTSEDIAMNAIVACPVSAILAENGNPYLGNVFVWHVSMRTVQHARHAGNVIMSGSYGAPYGASDARSGSTNSAAPLILDELGGLLRINHLSDAEQGHFSGYVRLTLSRIFVEYATMAALMIHVLNDEPEHPFVLTEAVAANALARAGYGPVRRDDRAIVCNLARRVLELAVERAERQKQ